MRVHLNFSIIASFVAASIAMQSSAYAQVKDVSVNGSGNAGVQVYVNTQQRSLYQVALLSGISVSELRQLNKGILDRTDIVKVGERIILPASSPLFSTERTALPELGKGAQTKVNNTERKVASALQTLGQQDWNNMTGDKAKDTVKLRLKNETESYLRNEVRTTIIDPIEAAAQNLLSKFGTAEVKLDVSDKFSLRGSSLKLFSPWYDSTNTVIFSQASIAVHDKRLIGNFGLGQRWDSPQKNWLFGYNVFLDHDFDRGHNRLGVGLEAWSDYLRFAANYYHPLSDWRESKDFEDHLERAARGFDVRAQAYLPSYPHLSFSLMYEKYFGDEVGLFGKDKLQKDPAAVSIGVGYTPVPMFTVSGEHKQGSSGFKEAKVDFKMQYRIGVPLKDQLDPNKVAAARSLKGSRYDFVDRNNNIILEYKDQRLSVDLAAIPGLQIEGSIVDLMATVKSRNVIAEASWDGTVPSDKLIQRTRDASAPHAGWSLIIPPYIVNNVPAKTYKLAMLVKDSTGRAGRSNTIDIQVAPSSSRKPVLTVNSKEGNVASLSAVLKDGDNAFNDSSIADSYPSSLANASLEKINEFWTVKDQNGNEIPIVLNKADCGNNIAGCAVVTSIGKSKVDGIDSFDIGLEYIGTGSATAQLTLKPYGDSNPVVITSNSGGDVDVSWVTITDGKSTITSSVNPNGSVELVIDKDDPILTAGNTLTVNAYERPNDNGSLISSPVVSWSLVGSNTLACEADSSMVTSMPTGPYFVVSEGSTYTIPSKNADSLATKGTSLNNLTISPLACAGDQGFALRVGVNEK